MRFIAFYLSKLPSALRHAIAYAGGLAVAKAISFLMLPVFTHHLSPADYGRLDVLQTLADLLSVVIGLGLADTLFRFAGSTGDAASQRRIAGSLYGYALTTGFVFLALVQLTAPLIHSLLPADVGLMETRMILISLSFSAIILIPLGWFRLTDRPGRYFLGTAGRAALQATLAAILLVLGMGVQGVILAGMIACLVLAAILSVHHIKDTGLRLQPKSWSGFTAYGGPLVFSGIAAFFLGSCDRWILAATLGPESLAPYAVAAKFSLVTAMLLQPFEMWWFSKRFTILNGPDGKRHAARAAEIGIVLVCLAVVTVSAAGPWLIELMTPASYHEATIYLPWICALAGFRAATNLLNLGIYNDRTTWRVLSIESGAALFAVVLFAILIPPYGPWGAITASGTALLLRLLVTYRLSQRRQALAYRPDRLLILCGATLGTIFLVTIFESTLARLILGPFAGAVIFAAAFALGLVPKTWLRLYHNVRQITVA